jgi:hypothetical protein
MAILHRKNALFYKTQNGARVGDLFMSLIYTCCQPFQLLDRVAETSPRTIPKPSRVDALNYRKHARAWWCGLVRGSGLSARCVCAAVLAFQEIHTPGVG